MATLVSRGVREVFRREAIPMRMLWWFAAEGMLEWFALLRDELAPHLGGRADAEATLSAIARSMLQRRYGLLRATFPHLPSEADEPRAVGLLMGALYRTASAPRGAWVFERSGGAPRGYADHVRAERLALPIPIRARWEELTAHLGDLLVALTTLLPDSMDRARPVLGELCFAAGERFGRKFRRAFALPQCPESALELLRMSEYVFRVNPEHWGGASADGSAGYLEGTACPWYEGPGWTGAHCGIFGQFQSGIASVFGLRYHLTTTIPKHGGHTCRIDVKPLGLRRGIEGAPLSMVRS